MSRKRKVDEAMVEVETDESDSDVEIVLGDADASADAEKVPGVVAPERVKKGACFASAGASND